ncbi:hypothetical protein Cgig2_033926 [Carnegiea gigantea]|uniref:Uncharacterized protein n=1 Tax=Carnegiea gigantea TaxID=171969 RepID=A0A9Q1JRX9_9CARY|nr:hypothetical protein Cgig2_033926 [Carnegiea gigantea]
MWAEDRDFSTLMEEQKNRVYDGCYMFQLVKFLKNLKAPLTKLNKDKCSDIHQDPLNKELQQEEEKCRSAYLKITKSSLRRQSSYVYSIINDRGEKVEGFTAAAKVMTDYYQKLLGEQRVNRVHPNQEVIQQGLELKLEQKFRLFYNAWYERNKVEFHKAQRNAQEVIKRIIEQVRQRILFLEFKIRRYTQLTEQIM